MLDPEVDAEARAEARLAVEVRGAVQGVGYRPFVYRLARELGLRGWVLNDVRGVRIEVEGPRSALELCLARLRNEGPPRAVVHSVDATWLEAPPFEAGSFSDFEIRSSAEGGTKSAVVLPDVATCPECLAEVLDPANRRYRYPFTNCTNCGPRFTIVEGLPYDRPKTTMRGFEMCLACRSEYEDPLDRRFHAQPNACPACGPQIALKDREGRTLAEGDAALAAAARALAEGEIVALKGLGGFQLLADARSAAAVALLRSRKARWEKPLALMARDLAMTRQLCDVSREAEAALASPEAPIVLLPRRADQGVGGRELGPEVEVADAVAPGQSRLGVMLPTTPLHHLLLREAGFPLVATSGNLSDEPIATDDADALERLAPLADLFLLHDRPIARHADDSVVTVAAGAPRLVRRARGYAPLPILAPRPLPTVLAVGPHLKATIALSVGERIFVSQYLGDLESPLTLAAFERAIADFLRLYEAEPLAIAHDLHPDYASTRWAADAASSALGSLGALPSLATLTDLPLVGIQHHHAHLASCLLENGSPGPALGAIWDGTGYGSDGTVWGGEFLLGDAAGFERVAHLRPFRLPGGEAAVREPRRGALAILWELLGEAALERDDLAPLRAFEPRERRLLGQMLARGLHAPVTTSVGRLIDAVASLLGLRQRSSFEGQAAMELEAVVDLSIRDAYPLPWVNQEGAAPAILDWQPMIEALLADLARGTAPGKIAARCHNALVASLVAVAEATAVEKASAPRVALSGGCFLNRILLERGRERLERAGFEVLLHRHVPPGDGGVSLGQIAVAAARLGV